ncbi:TPA: glycosyltransferase [Photobacterium damselae]
MNVLIYTQYWQKGGIEKLIQYMVSEFDNNYNLSILTEDVPDPENQYELEKQTKIYYRSFSPFNDNNQNKMRNTILNIDPDVIIVMGSNRSIYKVSRSLIGLDYPVIISEHNSSKELLRNFYNDERFLSAVRDLADYNHAIFPEFIETYKDTKKVRVIANPIVPLDNKANMESKKIVHIARYHLHQKQQDILIRAFANVANKYPDWSLDLYGGDWYGGQNAIKELVEKLNLTNQVNIYDATDDVGSVLETASIFAFPSAYEGFGLVVGEALSVGLPVIAFADCAGVNQLIINGSNGILVDGDLRDYHAFSNSLDLLMSDQKLREQYSKSAKESITDYSLDTFIRNWKELINSAYELKGKNRLKDLSDMELGYINYVSSGYMFDMINRKVIQRSAAKNKALKILRSLGLEKTVRSFYRKIKL